MQDSEKAKQIYATEDPEIVIDVENDFKYDYFENVYGSEGIVSYGEDNLAPQLFNNCYKNNKKI